MSISIQTEGRRNYIVGNTYAVRDQFRAIGAHWDAGRKMWWTAKRDEAEALVAKLAAAPATQSNGASKTPRDGLDSVVAGRAEYRGKTYYVAGRVERGRTRYDDVRAVQTQDGAKVLLYFRDGSAQFWAERAAVQVVKSYDRPQTIRGLQEFAAEHKAERAEQVAARKAAQRTPEQIEVDRAARIERIRQIAADAGVTLIEPIQPLSYDGRGQGGVSVGQTIARKDGTHLIIVVVSDPYYVSARDCAQDEDMGHYGTQPGWITPYEAVRIEEPTALRAAREAKAAAATDALAAYAAAKAPALAEGYRARHGSTLGGIITIDGESMIEPGVCATREHPLTWERIAEHVTRATTSSIAGRVMDQDTLFRCALPDGRYVYREDHYRGFGDDLRTTYYLPDDVYQTVIRAEVVAAGITREAAEKWLAEFRGCVGTELYEAALTIDTTALAAPHLSIGDQS